MLSSSLSLMKSTVSFVGARMARWDSQVMLGKFCDSSGKTLCRAIVEVCKLIFRKEFE